MADPDRGPEPNPSQQVVLVDGSGEEAEQAAELLSRGMRDNPLHLAAFGPDAGRRRRCLQRMFGALLRVRGTASSICAYHGDTLVGFTAIASPGACQLTPRQQLGMLPAVLAAGPASAARVLTWNSAWGHRDPAEPHVHLGPLAITPSRQGSGIGSRILAEHCRRLDADRRLPRDRQARERRARRALRLSGGRPDPDPRDRELVHAPCCPRPIRCVDLAWRDGPSEVSWCGGVR